MNRDEFPFACHNFGELCREVCVCGVCRACFVWLCLLCVRIGCVLLLYGGGCCGEVVVFACGGGWYVFVPYPG